MSSPQGFLNHNSVQDRTAVGRIQEQSVARWRLEAEARFVELVVSAGGNRQACGKNEFSVHRAAVAEDAVVEQNVACAKVGQLEPERRIGGRRNFVKGQRRFGGRRGRGK